MSMAVVCAVLACFWLLSFADIVASHDHDKWPHGLKSQIDDKRPQKQCSFPNK